MVHSTYASSDSLNVRDILSGSECLQSCSNHKFEETEKKFDFGDSID